MHSSRSSRTRWRCAWPRSPPPDPTDRAMFDAHWRRLLADPSVDARTVRADGRIVGSVARWYEDDTAEVTYWIDRAHWGEGIATRAVRLFLDALHERPVRVARGGRQRRVDRGAREARLRTDRRRGELRERSRHRDRGARLPARVSGAGPHCPGDRCSHTRRRRAVSPLGEVAVRHEVLSPGVERRAGAVRRRLPAAAVKVHGADATGSPRVRLEHRRSPDPWPSPCGSRVRRRDGTPRTSARSASTASSAVTTNTTARGCRASNAQVAVLGGDHRRRSRLGDGQSRRHRARTSTRRTPPGVRLRVAELETAPGGMSRRAGRPGTPQRRRRPPRRAAPGCASRRLRVECGRDRPDAPRQLDVTLRDAADVVRDQLERHADPSRGARRDGGSARRRRSRRRRAPAPRSRSPPS